MNKAKVLFLGPCQSGKTTVANFLSEATEIGGDYHPTQGCRILEFEVPNIEVGSRTVTVEVELWDVSGDTKFEACWPAIAKDTNGVVFLFNPDQSNHDKELEQWFSYFVENQGLKDEQCYIFAHHKTSGGDKDKPSLPSSMKGMTVVHTNIDEEGESVREEFSNYLSTMMTTMSDKREQEELSIMNSNR